MEKVRSGALEILANFPCEARIRSKPLTPCKKRAKLNKTLLQNKDLVRPHKGKSGLQAQQMSKVNLEAVKKTDTSAGVDLKTKMAEGARKGSFEQLISLSGLPNYQDLYEKFWDFFYTNGSFPPETFLSKWAEARGETIPLTSQNTVTDPSGPKNPQIALSPHPISQLSDGLHDANFGQSKRVVSGPGCEKSHSHLNSNGDCSAKKQCLMSADRPVPLCENFRQPSCNSAEGQNSYHPYSSEHSRSQEVRPMSATPFSSPLDMLCEAAMRTDPPRPQSHPPSLSSVPYPTHSVSLPGDGSQVSQAAVTPSQHPMQQTASPLPTNNPNSHSNLSVNATGLGTNRCADTPFCDPNKQFMCNPNQQAAMFQNGCKQQLSFQDEEMNQMIKTLEENKVSPEHSIIDPTVVRCEMDYNESNFRDPDIGGVAIALGHGSVLFEVAKRELHATTALRNPNRYHPTRISLVFYQHKNLNYSNHGWAEHEKKMELLHQKRLRAAVDQGVDVEDLKPGKRKKKKEESPKIDFAKTSAAQYKYMWDAPVRHGLSFTTDSIITRWIDPQPMVSGPYQRWV